MKTLLKITPILIFLILVHTALAQDECSYSSKGNNMIPDKLCAPVTADWSVSYGGVIYTGSEKIQIYFDWDDGSPTSIVDAAFNAGTGQWEAVQTHIYPKGGDKCNYRPSTMLVVNGTLCTSSIQTQIVTVWDVDDQNGGILSVSPAIYPICFGDNGATFFYDDSQWNCVPPIEYDTRNNFRRWTQWIYGTGGTNITTAKAGGVIRNYPYAGPIIATGQPVEGPQPPMEKSMFIEIPAGYKVGDYFEVTLRNWNYCNPYDDPNIAGTPSDPINGDNDPIEITAIALIVALPDGTITAVGPFCENELPIDLKAATPNGIWSGTGITNPSTGQFSPSVAGPGLHTINYDVTDPNGCPATGTTQIEVWDSPDVSLSVTDPIYLCPGVTQPIEATVINGTLPYTIGWTGDIGPLITPDILNPIFQTTVTGVYHIEFTAVDDRGCTSKAPLTIEVNPVNVDFSPPLLEVCQFSSVTLEPIASGGSSEYILHEWSGTDISKLTPINGPNPVLNTDDIGVYVFNYRVTDNQGCSDESTITVTIKEQPIANAGPDETSCLLTHSLSANTWPGATSQWSIISGTGILSISDTFAADATITADQTGTYILNWEVNLNGCIDNDQVEIIFSPTPNPQVIPDFSICGLTAQIEAIPDFAGGSWLLTSGPGNAIFNDATQPITTVDVDTPGVYTFTWQEAVGAGCDGYASLQVTFMPQAKAIVDPVPALGCSPYEISFPNNSINAESYSWNLSGGLFSTEENPVQIYENFTSNIRTIEIILEASNSYGCNDTFTFDVQVAPKPTVSAMAIPPYGCAPLETSFINNSSGGTKYLWNFNDGSPVTDQFDPTHTFNNDNTYIVAFPVKLYVENDFGCKDSSTTYVTVYPSSPLPLAITPQEGCHPLSVSLISSPGSVLYNWDYGDGIIESGEFQTSHIFNNTSENEITYLINLDATNPFSCASTATAQVTVFPSPEAEFLVTPTELQMPDRTVTITNETKGTNWSYTWNFGDGSTSDLRQPGTHTYPESGSYTIELAVTNGQCFDETTQDILIKPMTPVIEYGADPTSGCPPLTVMFWNKTLDATSYLWEFGDGMMLQEQSPTHTYLTSGTYNVKLTATGPGGISIAENLTVEVFEKPFAQFEIIPKVIFIPGEKPVFINYSIGATRYEWDFGDGETSTEFSPSHQYQQPGVFTISLWVINNQGCKDQFTLPEAVKVEQGGEIVFPNAFTPNPSGPSDGRYSFGDPRNHIFYPFVQKGIVEYQLQIFTRWGELIFESNDIEIGWDGYRNKKLVPQGVYIWRARYKTANGKVEIKAGDITLIR